MSNPSPSSHPELVATFRQALDGRLLDCNEACAFMLGYSSRDELLGRGLFDYANASDFHAVIAALRDLGSVSGVEVAVRRKDARMAWVLQNLFLEGKDSGAPMQSGRLYA